MENMTGSSIFKEWARRYAPGLIETRTTFDLDPTLGIPPKQAPIEGVFSGKGAPSLSVPSMRPAKIEGPTAFPAPEVAPQENSLANYVPQQPIPETAPGEGEKEPRGISPGAIGLLGAGFSMMATPPRQVPYSNLEILGRGGQAGIAYYEKALEDKRRQQALDISEKEHRLTREDRRTAAEDRASYYKDRATTARIEAESRDEARKATAKENAVLDVPIDPKVAEHYGVDPKMTVRTFNKMQAGLTAMAKPEKEVKTDPFTEWYQKRVEETGKAPSAKDIEGWHRNPSTSGGDADSGPGKVGAIGAVNRELVAMYLPHGRKNLEAKGPAGAEELKGMMLMLGNTDQYGGTVNDARLRESLSPDERKEYDFVKRKGQDYSRTMTPANAIAKAQEEWKASQPKQPAAQAKAAAQYQDYKRVYEEIMNYPGWSNAEKNAKIEEMNDKARKMGLIK